MVGAVDGAETFHLLMLWHAYLSLGGHGEVLITTEVVVAAVEGEVVVVLVGDLSARHPGIDGDAVFFLAGLIVEGCLGGELLRVVVDVGTEELLLEGAGVLVFFIALHADVGEQQGDAEWVFLHVVVIPHGFHRLVGLQTAGEVGAAIDVGNVLVEGADDVQLMSEAFVAQLQGVVRHGGHRPVVAAEDALVVVGQRLSSDLCKEPVLRVEVDPCLVDVEAVGLVAAPHTTVLCGGMGYEAGPLVADAEQCSGNDEGGLVVGALFVGQSALAQLTAREEVQVDDEFVLLGGLCRIGRRSNG